MKRPRFTLRTLLLFLPVAAVFCLLLRYFSQTVWPQLQYARLERKAVTFGLTAQEFAELVDEMVRSSGERARFAEFTIRFLIRGESSHQVGVPGKRYLPSDCREAIGPAISALHSCRVSTRCTGASILGAIGPDAEVAVPELLSVLSDPEPTVQVSAGTALLQISPGNSLVVTELARLARTATSSYVRTTLQQLLDAANTDLVHWPSRSR
jgi:hypothetical protein